ncbi:MAG: hypothetical protein LBP78_08175, partial [Acidaminococcales bacterium]|nr:hypothetical protein [Acidaminococcales bacterium]
RETEELLRHGFRAIKLKIGQKDLKKDEEAVRIVRETIGKEAFLMLDANSCYDAASAIEAGKLLEKYNIYWLEEPVPADDHNGYKKVSQKLNIRIAGGESEFTARDFNDLLKKNCIDIVQPDVARAGGISECRKIALLADVYNKLYAPHVGMSSAICSFASLHLAAAMPNHLTYEYMFIENPLQKIFNFELLPPVDGKISVPERPGLGIEINEKEIKRYLV